jgi:hypothetical protein
VVSSLELWSSEEIEESSVGQSTIDRQRSASLALIMSGGGALGRGDGRNGAVSTRKNAFCKLRKVEFETFWLFIEILDRGLRCCVTRMVGPKEVGGKWTKGTRSSV